MTEHGRDRVIYDMYAHPFDDEWQVGAWGKAALSARRK
jgi:hypothetical protein